MRKIQNSIRNCFPVTFWEKFPPWQTYFWDLVEAETRLIWTYSRIGNFIVLEIKAFWPKVFWNCMRGNVFYLDWFYPNPYFWRSEKLIHISNHFLQRKISNFLFISYWIDIYLVSRNNWENSYTSGPLDRNLVIMLVDDSTKDKILAPKRSPRYPPTSATKLSNG